MENNMSYKDTNNYKSQTTLQNLGSTQHDTQYTHLIQKYNFSISSEYHSTFTMETNQQSLGTSEVTSSHLFYWIKF